MDDPGGVLAAPLDLERLTRDARLKINDEKMQREREVPLATVGLTF